MKAPDKDTIYPLVLAVDLAIGVALQNNFDEDSALELTLRLDELYAIILKEDEGLPIGLKDESVLACKALVMADIAYACWINDEASVSLPQEVILNFIARMRLNPEHCKITLDLTRMRLKQHGKLLSVETQSLRIQ